MSNLVATERVFPTPQSSATNGEIVVLPMKAAWLCLHGIGGLIGLLFFVELDAVIVFLVLTSVTICAGHSVGMHRLLIHRSFKTHPGVCYVLVWLGTCVGMAGPIGMIHAHDMRDWHQRQEICPPHPSHGAPFWRDAYWQLMCEFRLDHPPFFSIEEDVADDKIYQFLERTWMLQQVLPAAVLFAVGGWAWVLWGCCARVFVSLTGHWCIGHFAHKRGQMTWKIEGLPVQGYNLPGFGLLTFGENWHGNHHAYPYSAQLGIGPGQFDPGYLFVRCLAALGLAWDIQLPGSQPERRGLTRA